MSIYLQAIETSGSRESKVKKGTKSFDVYGKGEDKKADKTAYYGTAFYVDNSAQAILNVVGIIPQDEFKKFVAVRNKRYE